MNRRWSPRKPKRDPMAGVREIDVSESALLFAPFYGADPDDHDAFGRFNVLLDNELRQGGARTLFVRLLAAEPDYVSLACHDFATLRVVDPGARLILRQNTDCVGLRIAPSDNCTFITTELTPVESIALFAEMRANGRLHHGTITLVPSEGDDLVELCAAVRAAGLVPSIDGGALVISAPEGAAE